MTNYRQYEPLPPPEGPTLISRLGHCGAFPEGRPNLTQSLQGARLPALL